jgi:hypothetical protein
METTHRPHTNLLVTTVLVGLVTVCVSFVGVNVAGLNVWRYYPELRVFQTQAIEGQVSMGFYGRVLVALGIAAIAMLVYLVFYKALYFFRLARIAYLSILAFGAIWIAASLIVWEEWHKWGIEARDSADSGFFNAEFVLFVVGMLIFLVGVFLSASGAQRVVHISQTELKPNKAPTVQ